MGSGHHHGSARVLTFAFGLTAAYLVVEVIGGLLTGSLALLADAGHMLSDAGALLVALTAARLAARPPDARQTMGYQRAEVLGAAVNAGALVVIAVWITVEAIERLADPREILAGPMMAVAFVGLVINLVIAWWLHGDAHSINTRAALLHVMGDALGSVGAIVAGAAVWFAGATWADPAVSVLISAILLLGSSRVLREVVGVLMHATPQNVDVPALEHEIAHIEGVHSIHDLHVWTLRPGEDVLTVHVVVDGGAEPSAVCAAVRARLCGLLPSAHVTVQPEAEGAPCSPAVPGQDHASHAHPH